MDEVLLGLRFTLAAVFILAGLSKLPRLAEFEDVVERYAVLPKPLVRPLSRLLPVFELLSGVLLAVGLLTTPTAVVVSGVLCMFAVGVAVNLLRGNEIDCGCFSAAAPRRITWFVVVRNLLLAGSAVLVALRVPSTLSLDGVLSGADDGSLGEGLAVVVASTTTLAGIALAVEAMRLRRIAGRLAMNSTR